MMNLLMTLALAAPPEAAATPESPKLAVMDLELKKGLDQATAEMLNELMLERLSRSKRFGGVIGGSDLREMLSLEEQKAAMGCDADSCLAELGGALGVPLMLSSSLGTFAGNYILNLKLISVEDAKVLARTSRVVRDESKLLDELGASLDQIVAEGMDGAAKPSGEPAPASVKSKSKGASGGVWIATAGGGLLVGGLVAGVLLNNVGDSRLHGAQTDFVLGLTSWTEFSSAVERRNRLNLIGGSLGALGAVVTAYGLWGR